MSLSLWPVWLCTYFDSGSTELNGVGCHSKHTGRNKRFLCHVHVRRTTWASFNMVNRKVCQQTAHEVNTFLHSRWDRWAMLDKATGELVATTLELHECSNKRLGRNWDIKTCWDFFEGHCWVKVVKVFGIWLIWCSASRVRRVLCEPPDTFASFGKVIHMGIIDFLQPWTMSKVAAMCPCPSYGV